MDLSLEEIAMSAGLPKGKIAAVIAVLVIVLCTAGYLVHLNGDSFDFSNTETKLVTTASMDAAPPTGYEISSIPAGGLVFIEKVHGNDFYSSLKVGDVLTFDYIHPVSRNVISVTHRIIDIKETSGVYTYTMKGDAVDGSTGSSVQIVTSDSGDIDGKVVGVSHVLGVLVSFFTSSSGKVVTIAAICAAAVVACIASVRSGNNSDEGPGKKKDVPKEGS